eukprot:m.117986 g.117986  ORF g.117986 m.117986 type:complete len:202 (-) comp17194_c0_seq2:473-1078(-)
MDVENMHHSISFRMPSSAKKGLSLSNKSFRSGVAPTPVKIFSENNPTKDGLKTPSGRPRKALGDLSNRRGFGDRTSTKAGGTVSIQVETTSSRKQQPRRLRRAKVDIEICPIQPPPVPEYEDHALSEQLDKNFKRLMNPSVFADNIGQKMSTPPSIAKTQTLVDDDTVLPTMGAIWNGTLVPMTHFVNGHHEVQLMNKAPN